MPLEALISTYGYAAIAAGAFFEGETVMVLGGLAVQQGYLAMPGVLASAFVATLVADHIYFYLGRAQGLAFLDKRPAWKARSGKAFALLRRHQTLATLSFRFFYGLRILIPFALGATRIPRLRFAALDAIGSAVWVATYGTLGYLFGHTVEAALGDVRRYQIWFFAAVALLGGLVWVLHRWPRRRPPPPPPDFHGT